MIDRVDELFDAHCREVGGPFWAELPHIEQQRLMLMAEASYRPLDKGEVVKPLVWSGGGNVRYPIYHAHGLAGFYVIRTGGASMDGAFDLERNQFTVKRGGFPTLEEAKAAAEADHVARIRSALVSQPAPKGVEIMALREAAQRLMWLLVADGDDRPMLRTPDGVDPNEFANAYVAIEAAMKEA